MNQTPFEQVSALRIGMVDFVSPDEIKVLLDIDAPESVALNTGALRPFPRVNGYLLIPVDEALLVGQVEWLTVERSAFPKRRGMQDFGLVDLPYPLRKLRFNPLGTLRKLVSEGGLDLHPEYAFRRGADALPSVGATVVLPTEKQLRSIVESGEQRRVKIGTSPLAGDAEVRIDPNRMFGRHLAVLGNTGSGKSCSVAGLIRWSMEEAVQAHKQNRPNARFIVLDPNGEYSRAFSGDDVVKARIFKVNPSEGEFDLKVPLWFWNSAEWSSFTQASARTQRPLLRRALREVKAGRTGVGTETNEDKKLALRRYLSSRLITIRKSARSGLFQTEETKFGFRLKAILDDLEKKCEEFSAHGIESITDAIKSALEATTHTFTDKETGKPVEYYRAFTETHINQIEEALRTALDGIGGIIHHEGPDEDVPLAFSGTDLADHIEILAEDENVIQYLDFLITRIRSFLASPQMRTIIENEDDLTLEDWLSDHIGESNAQNGCVSIIDLSLVPTEIVHVVTAVIARMTFESLQRYVKENGASLPTVLVMDEAHTFVKRYKEDIENQDAASICCQVFERIAREGRKFGLGLVLSSQRPSELSPTVLSQCNSFLLHRISNDRDQDLVQRFVPDNLRGLLRELPSLPSQNAILLGWASELPVLVKMNDLPQSQQPRSDDPDFWGVWVGQDDAGTPISREVDWQRIAADWQAGPVAENRSKEEDET